MTPIMQESSFTSSIEMDAKLIDLLCPIRDPTKNWEINIAAALEEYLSKLEGLHSTSQNGCLPLNFAQAALIIQGSTSVYCKKVEYLCTLCQQMLHLINSERRCQPQTNEACKEKDIPLASSACDDFCSLDDLKIQKGLELAEDEHHYSNKRSLLPFTPVMLIRLEEREKGHTLLLNFKGEVIGNKQDYNLNICNLDDSGALSFPMSFTEFATKSLGLSSTPLECGDDDSSDCAAVDNDVSEFMSCSPSSSNSAAPAENESHPAVGKRNRDASVERDVFDIPTAEDNLGVPTENRNVIAALKTNNSGVHSGKDSSKPVRKSARQGALKAKRAAEEKKKSESRKNNTSEVPKVAKQAKKKAVEKKVTGATPKSKIISERPKLPPTVDPAEGFRCDSFYSSQTKCPSIILKVPAVNELDDMFWTGSQKKPERPITCAEEVGVSHENCEDDATKSSDDNGCSSPEGDGHVDDVPEMMQQDDSADILQPCSSSAVNEEVPAVDEVTQKGIESYLNSIAHYCRTDDLTKKVSEWEERIKPLLEMESEREAFDIHAYESKVMSNFEDNSRKQTVSFSKICKGKEKWEVCRYFVASLQLANSCNVDISTNDPASGNGMELTLMSRKMQNGDHI